ncbi:hypothetical protein MKY83_13325 [Bacillus sp. FSL M8-0266]|uniref:hypothetical protein n=1 Tax=Bacillus TaxID=1386 RepID=UPI0031586D7E
MKMFLDLTYKSIFDQLNEALSKKTLIVTTARTRRIGKTQALVELAAIKKIPIVVKDLMVNSYKKEYPNVLIFGETATKSLLLLDTVLVEEGVQETTITILRDKGVTVSGFFVDPRWSVVDGEYVPYEERKKRTEHGIEQATTVLEPPLLQITLKDIHSVPEVVHNGETLKGLIDVDINWKTGGLDKYGSAYVNLRTAGEKGKRPIEKRIEYKRGEAMDELPTKDDLVWDKERGIYLRPWKNVNDSTVH